ncbi:MAG: response regulator, partial [Gammaproteobacteria bacterium]|nr:response regulator [Gammaproteobacteria bacterium]
QLILMDINMQGMNGYQALEILKNNADTSSIAVIAISADAMPHQIEEGLAKGFVDYLPKPFNINDLINKLEQRLG